MMHKHHLFILHTTVWCSLGLALAWSATPIVNLKLQSNMDAGGYLITNLAAPVASNDAATKAYVDSNAASGGTTNLFSSSSNGLVPSSGANTNYYLRGDATWQAIAGGGDMLASTYDTNANGIVDTVEGLSSKLDTNGSGAGLTGIAFSQLTGSATTNQLPSIPLPKLDTNGASAGQVPMFTNSTVAWATVSSSGASIFTSVPALPNSTGTAGQMAYSTNYLYICVSSNSWRRVPLATW